MLIGRHDERLNKADRKKIRDAMIVGDGDAAAPNPVVQCPEPYMQDGKPYRLVAKPKARPHILEKYGHISEVVGGVLHAQVPLGTHGTDGIGIDPETGDIGCCLCDKIFIKG